MTNVAVSDTGTRERRDFKIIDETNDYIVVDKPPLLLIHPPSQMAQQRFGRNCGNYLRLKLRAVGKFPIVNRLDLKRAALSWLRKQQLRPGNSGG